MAINYQKNNYNSALQSLKSSFTGISETRTSKQASVVKKVALAVINLLLIPFRLAQSAYYNLFKLKIEPKTGFELNRAAILKTALIGMGAIGLIALGYKPSPQSSQIGLLSDIPKLALGGVVSLCEIGIFALKKKSIKNSEIAQAQIDFADKLVAELERNFAGNETLSNVKKLLDIIKKNSKLSLVKKADAINKAIINCLDFDPSLKNSVRNLDLSNKGLKTILPCIGNFPNLKSLYLANNQLTELPDAIRALTELELLSLHKNQLKELPDAIGALTKLEHLFLDNNQLTELPDAIGALTKLENLFLGNNQLTKLPDAIRTLTRLKILFLENNKLTELSKAISDLQGRQVIVKLRGNPISNTQ